MPSVSQTRSMKLLLRCLLVLFNLLCLYSPADEFQRICTNLTIWGDNVNISTSKEGIKFAVTGDAGASGNVFLRPHIAVDDKGISTTIESTKDISLGFALRKLVAFTKATPLTNSVALSGTDILVLFSTQF